ncbi:hypothetical protein [Chryseobacterium gilvum]|uniref:hypothetical protein n=1 Tax=Chryseobacterium gilvum TaxID=2976534 RepID=UPI0021D5E422|nr:hypothetical protein [Chryseobacterium gilvum]
MRIDYSSDSSSMLILILILLFTSGVFSFAIRKKWAAYFLVIAEYVGVLYISVILIKYGSDKIFHTQFPKPESNILLTRFGNLDKDIVFWSTIGTSKIYNSVIGFIEFFTGILLLFRRFRVFGLLLAIISFTQILIINIGFDISVKLFSSILLIMSIFLVRKEGWKLILKMIHLPKETFFDQSSFLPYTTFFKILVVGIVLVKIAMPYLKKEDQKNALNISGTYLVTSSGSPYQYLFFHKDQYLIFMEKHSEKMTVFHYDMYVDHYIILEDNQHHISKHILLENHQDSTIVFSFKNQIIHAKAVNSEKMNVLQDRLHMLID